MRWYFTPENFLVPRAICPCSIWGRSRDKNPDKLNRQDSLRAHSRLGGLRWDRVRRPLAPLVYNRAHKWRGTGAAFQRANHVRRQRTSGDSLPVESILGRQRNRIRVTRIRRPLRQKFPHTRRVRSKPAHALREAIAAEGSAASHV